MTASPRRRGLRILLLAVGVLLVGVVALWQFADRWLGQMLVAQAGARIDGQLRIEGPVSLQVFPPRLMLADIVWQGPGDTPSRLHIDHLALTSDWAGGDGARPLFIDLDGVRGQLRQQADGQWQAPRPQGGADGAEGTLPLRLARLSLSDLALDLVGQGAAPITLRLDRAQLAESPAGWQASVAGGGVRAGAQLDGTLTATLLTTPTGPQLADVSARAAGAVGGVRLDSLVLTFATARQTPEGGLQADGLTTEMQAQDGAQHLRLTTRAASLAHTDGRTDLTGVHALATLTPAGPAASASATLDAAELHLADGQLTAAGRLHLATALPAGPVEATAERLQLTADPAAGRIEATLPTVHARLPDPAKPGAQVALDAELDGHWDTDARRGAGTVSAQVERSRLDGQWQVDLEKARWLVLQARVDRLDMDRWQPPRSKPAEPLPLDAWRDWPMQLDLQVGRLRLQGVDARDTRLRINTSP